MLKEYLGKLLKIAPKEIQHVAILSSIDARQRRLKLI
jgi:hypothetical protein